MVISVSYITSGCSSSTTTPPTTTQGNVSPKKGSTYAYAMYKDTAGTKVPNSDTTFSATVTADSMQFSGQSNVYTVMDNGDTVYLAYALNNDAMIYYQSTGLNGVFKSIGDVVFHRWITLGTSSKTSAIIINNMADTIVYSGISIPAIINLSNDYIGDTTIIVGTESIPTNHCRITATAVSNTLLLTPSVKYTSIRDIYFSTKIGYAAQATTSEVIPSIALAQLKGSSKGTFKILTSYNLK